MFAIQRLRRAEIHRNSVLHDLVLLQDLIEHRERPSTVDHVIFRDDFEPIDDRFLLENVLVVRNPQADSDSVFGESVETICRHRNSSQGGIRRTCGPPVQL